MLFATLPYDYLEHFGRGERVRRSQIRPTGRRVRRLEDGKRSA